jgi:LuxR family transcriptional regulator, maltose regulon positive regulatory protein
MPAPLLTTKYHLPPVAFGSVVRLRLFERLDELLLPGKRLAWVCALAGSGKTTIVRTWVEHLTSPGSGDRESIPRIAWLSLDVEENDPATFLTYLVTAIQTACPEFIPGTILQSEMNVPYTFPPVRTVLAEIVNQLAGFADPVILILDDYHVISASAIQEGMTFLLEHLPENTRLVMATRAESLLPVSRLRARGQLIEIREADLRFTLDEAAIFLDEITELHLSQPEIELLVERTEGWAAGLQMAALALRSLPGGTAHTQEFVRAFSGSHRYILDYLMDEVFSGLPEPTQSFLLETAFLDRMCADLCKTVLAQACSGAGRSVTVEDQLPSLSQANLFVIPLDEERRWYRYHHLFAELLRNRMRQESTMEDIAERERRASAWFAERGLVLEAIHYSLLAGDVEQAADQMESCAQEVISDGRLAILSQWLAALPADVLTRRPRLRIFQALVSFLKGDAATAITALEETQHILETLPEADSTQALKRELISILAISNISSGNAQRVLSLVEVTLETMPETELIPRARLLFARGMAYAMSSDKRYYALIKQALVLARRAGDIYLAANILNMQAMGAVFFQAQYHTAWQMYGEIIRLCSPAASEGLPLPAAMGYTGRAAIALEWNDLAQAADLLERSVVLSRQGGQASPGFSSFLVQARLAQARGDWNAARGALEEAASNRIFDDNIAAVAQLAQAQVRLHLASGQIEAAVQCAAGEGLPPASRPSPGHPALVREVWTVLQARVLLAQEHPIEALALLDPLIPQAKSAGRLARVIEGSLYQAMCLYTLQRDALAPLSRALAAGQPQGVTRLFLEAGQSMNDLLLAYHSRLGELAVEAERLLHLLGEPGASLPSQAAEMVEPLTARETDVLRLLCEGKSNQEIAAALFLSLSAVKKYTGNLYGKLGVASRAQAIVKAHELRLVPPPEK